MDHGNSPFHVARNAAARESTMAKLGAQALEGFGPAFSRWQPYQVEQEH
jgi:hypothetical protein